MFCKKKFDKAERELYLRENGFIFCPHVIMVNNSKYFQSLDERSLQNAYDRLVVLVADLSEDQKNAILQRLYSDVLVSSDWTKNSEILKDGLRETFTTSDDLASVLWSSMNKISGKS